MIMKFIGTGMSLATPIIALASIPTFVLAEILDSQAIFIIGSLMLIPLCIICVLGILFMLSDL